MFGRNSVKTKKTQFQFHNGTIKSKSCVGFTWAKHTYFNSTMVRLKVALYALGSPIVATDFNSTMVRLKDLTAV